MAHQTCSGVLGDDNDKMCSLSADKDSDSKNGQTGCSRNSLGPGNDHITSTFFSGKCHINNLPRELLMYIFSFLSVPELCISVAPVCTAWRDLSKEPILWTRLAFKDQVEGKKVQRILERSPLLLSLELHYREDAGDLLLQMATHCTKLRRLVLRTCRGMTKTTFKMLKENCPGICSLDMALSPVFRHEFYDMLTEFHQLRYLNLSHCDVVDSSGLEIIAKQCQQLEYLNIKGNTHIYDDAVLCLTKELSHCLKNLFIDGSNLTDTAYQSLRACHELQQLGVSSCKEMTDVGVIGISSLRYLTLLELRNGIQLTSEGLTSLFRSGGLPLLTHVDLESCSLVDDTVLTALSCTCQRLVYLKLVWCKEVTDAGVSAIMAACPRLRVLDLGGVMKLTGTPFIELPSALPDLRILFLEHCREVDDMILKRIVAQKPSLKVFNYWGNLVMPHTSDARDEY